MKKRGQVAMEFLMTYGWAILIILIAVGALWMLGVFSPNISTNCSIDPPFSCQDAVIGTKGVSFKLALGSDATGRVNNVEVNGKPCDITENEIKSNQATTISCNGLDLEEDDSISVTIDASYSRPGKFTKPVEGVISGTAKKGEEKYVKTYTGLSGCGMTHGLAFDGNYFYFPSSGCVTQKDKDFQQVRDITGLGNYIYTGAAYDKKNRVYWGLDWTNKQITKFSDNTFSTPSPQWGIGGEPIDITSDGTYLYTNHRIGKIIRHKIDDSIGNDGEINMDGLAGFTWSGQGITYLNGYLYAGTTFCCRTPAGQNSGRIYVIDISDWNNPRIVHWWQAKDLSEIGGLTNDGEYLYAIPRAASPLVKYKIPPQW